MPSAIGGTTDLGVITLDPAPACFAGTLTYSQCLSGPVQDPVDLFERDPQTGHLSRVGRVTPDATGRFCALLRRGRFYFLRKEDVPCGDRVLACQAVLVLNDPTASGFCGEAGARCQEAGNLGLVCGSSGGA